MVRLLAISATLVGLQISEHYTIGRRLASATFTVVHELWDSSGPVPIVRAVKVLNTNFTTLEDIEREIEILGRLNHPSVVKVIDVIRSPPITSIVMAHSTFGGTLLGYMLSKPNRVLDEPTARLVFRQLILGVKHCHEQGVVHRDIRPQNLMTTSTGDALIIADFGLAGFIPPSGQGLTDRCGAPHYVAPEVIHDDSYGPEVDIWSCGVTLYVLLTGGVPFDDPMVNSRNYDGLWRKINQLNYADPVVCSLPAADLIKRILVHRAQRIPLDEILAHPWLAEAPAPSPVLGADPPASGGHDTTMHG